MINRPCTRKERELKRMDMQVIFLSNEILVIINVEVKGLCILGVILPFFAFFVVTFNTFCETNLKYHQSLLLLALKP